MGRMRKEYNPREEARKILAKFSPEQLLDKAACEAATAKVSGLSPIILGKLRKELQNGDAVITNGNGKGVVYLKHIGAVSRASKAVGGFGQLKATIAAMEKIGSVL